MYAHGRFYQTLKSSRSFLVCSEDTFLPRKGGPKILVEFNWITWYGIKGKTKQSNWSRDMNVSHSARRRCFHPDWVVDPGIRWEKTCVFPPVLWEECINFNEELIWSNDVHRASQGKIRILLCTMAQCQSKFKSSREALQFFTQMGPLLPSMCWDSIPTVPTGSCSFDWFLNYVNTKQNNDYCILFFSFGFLLFPRWLNGLSCESI